MKSKFVHLNKENKMEIKGMFDEPIERIFLEVMNKIKGIEVFSVEHLLLVALQDRRLLISSHVLDVTLNKVRAALKKYLDGEREKNKEAAVDIGFSAEAGGMIRVVRSHMENSGKSLFYADNLLLVILHDDKSFASSLLKRYHISYDYVKKTIVKKEEMKAKKLKLSDEFGKLFVDTELSEEMVAFVRTKQNLRKSLVGQIRSAMENSKA